MRRLIAFLRLSPVDETAPSQQPSQPSAFQRLRHRADSINQRLLLTFALVSIVPLIISGLFNSSAVRDLMENEAVSAQAEITRLVADKINRYLDNAQAALRDVGEDWRSLRLSNQQLVTYLRNFVQDEQLFIAVWIMDTSGQEIVGFQNGDLIAASALQNRSEYEVFFRAARGETYFSTVRLVNGQPQLTLSLPLTYDGDYLGVIAAHLNLSQPWEIIRSTQVGATGSALLVDRRGNLVVHPNQTMMQGQINLAMLPPVSEISADVSDLGTEVISLTYASPFGGQVLGSANLIPGPNWVLVVERQTSDAFSAIEVARSSLLIVICVTLIVAISLSLFLSRQLTRPIIQLRDAANRIRRGELSLRIPEHNRTEIGDLARAFNSMTAALQNQITEIDEKNRALTVANAKAAEASRLKDEFLAMISHELRTPMNAIVGYTGLMLMDDHLTTEHRNFLERVDSSSQRLLLLINDILDLSRLEAGKIQLHVDDVPIHHLAAAWETQMKVLANEKKIELEVLVAPEMPHIIRSDEEALTKIAINLLSNAIKFTDHGWVRLTMMPVGAHWQIRVRDTGIGIPQEMQDAVFDRFRQVDGSFKRRHGGTGLGLAIVRNITQVMGGSVTLESIPSKGTTFTVTLPLEMNNETSYPNTA